MGGQDGCEPRIKVIVKCKKKVRGGARVDVNKKLKLLSYCENAKKRKKCRGDSGRGPTGESGGWKGECEQRI